MMTLADFEASCSAWLVSKEPSEAQFKELLTSAFEVLVGTQQRDIAAHLKIAESTVSRWVKNSTCPHPLIQRKVIGHLLRRARASLGRPRSGSGSHPVAHQLAAKGGN